MALEKEISCFIPAIDELRIKLKATVSRAINIRFTVKKCALTNILRVKWNLIDKTTYMALLPRTLTPSEKEQAYDRIVAGVY